MTRFRREFAAFSLGGTTLLTAFFGALGGVDYASLWTQILSIFLSALAALFVGADPSVFFQNNTF